VIPVSIYVQLECRERRCAKPHSTRQATGLVGLVRAEEPHHDGVISSTLELRCHNPVSLEDRPTAP
jgi:hypothetical protein